MQSAAAAVDGRPFSLFYGGIVNNGNYVDALFAVWSFVTGT